MDALDKKLLRDFRRLWVQALAIALVMAGGVSILLMSFGMSGALDDTRNTYYERNRFADVFASARRVPKSLMQDIRAIEGVAAAEERASAAGLDGPYLLTETAADFFSGRGYSVIPRDEGPQPIMASVEWATACGESAVPMVRSGG